VTQSYNSLITVIPQNIQNYSVVIRFSIDYKYYILFIINGFNLIVIMSYYYYNIDGIVKIVLNN